MQSFTTVSFGLLPLLSPLTSILVIGTIALCLFRFFQLRISELTHYSVNQTLLTEFSQVSYHCLLV